MPIIFLDNGKFDTVACENCMYYNEKEESCYKFGFLDDYCRHWVESSKSKAKPKRRIKKRLE